MAFKRGGHKRPQYSISTSVAIRKGKYLKGPSFGLWLNDGNVPMARGSVKENYLSELVAFLRKAEGKDLSVSFALFKNKDKMREEEEEEEEDEEEEEEEEEDEEEDEDEKPAKKTGKKSSKSEKAGGKKGDTKSGKKSDWDFDDSEDD